MATSTLTITRSATAQQSSSLPINITMAGTATLTTDFTITAGTATITSLTAVGFVLTIPASSLTGTATITTVADTVFEQDETIILTINPTAGVSSGTGSVTYIITNDDNEIQVLTISLSSTSGLEG
jgi:hypothetical protein